MEKMHGIRLYLALPCHVCAGNNTWSWVGEHCFKGTGWSSQDQYPEEERGTCTTYGQFGQFRCWWRCMMRNLVWATHDELWHTRTHTARLKTSVYPKVSSALSLLGPTSGTSHGQQRQGTERARDGERDGWRDGRRGLSNDPWLNCLWSSIITILTNIPWSLPRKLIGHRPVLSNLRDIRTCGQRQSIVVAPASRVPSCPLKTACWHAKR